MAYRRQRPRTRWIAGAILVVALALLGGATSLGQRPPDTDDLAGEPPPVLQRVDDGPPAEHALGDIPLDDATYQEYLKVTPYDMAPDALPSSYDARDNGIVTVAKSQGGCGSCWAFAATGAMESHILMAGGDPLDLAEQQQVSCNTSQSGCSGGSSSSIRYWQTKGPLHETCFPYTASDATPCAEASCDQLPYRVINYYTVQQTTADFKTSLFEDGPSYWRYVVYSDFDDYWDGGLPGDVYVSQSGATYRGGHAVLLIGWDDAKAVPGGGTGAFLCKNSWGATGGPNNDGTFWIAYTGHYEYLGFGMANFSLTYLDYCTWTGAVSTDWHTDANWDCIGGVPLVATNHIPSPADDVVIPSFPTGARWPTISTGAADARDLTVETGSQLSMTGGTLNIDGRWKEESTGVFHGVGGTVALVGGPAQTAGTSSGSSFYDLEIGAGAGSTVVALHSDIDVNGDLTIHVGSSLAGGSNTIAVAGDWTDYGASFIPGASTVVFDGADQTVDKSGADTLLTEAFATWDSPWDDSWFTSSPPAGWTTASEGDGSASNTWFFGRYSPWNGDSGFALRWIDGTPAVIDAWLFSPSLDLTPSDTYTIEFRYRVASGTDAQDFHVWLGSNADSGSMSQPLWSVAGETGTSWSDVSQVFTVTTAGEYHLGFNNYDAPGGYYGILLDDIAVTGAGELTFHDLTVGGTGSATFSGDVTVVNDLTVNAGATADLGTHDLTVGGTLVNSGSLRQTRDVASGTTVDFLQVGDGAGGHSYYGARLTDTSGLGLGVTTVEIAGNQECPELPPASYPTVERCFDISPASANTATGRFFYLPNELNGLTASALNVYHLGGDSWSLETGSYTREADGGDYDWVQVTGLDAYSPFVLGDDQPTLVAVSSFAAAPHIGHMLISWQTVSEINLSGFNLYRAQALEGPWVQLNSELIQIKAPGSPHGESYTWGDWGVEPCATYHYVLEAVYTSGAVSESSPISATAVGCHLVFLPATLR